MKLNEKFHLADGYFIQLGAFSLSPRLWHCCISENLVNPNLYCPCCYKGTPAEIVTQALLLGVNFKDNKV